MIECKNLIGNIEIDSSGAFTRIFNYGKMYRKEGIYSPITQNQRHMEVIKAICKKSKSNWLTKTIFDKYFEEEYRSIVVLANPKSYLNAKYAKKEVKNQVIRCDQLIDFIKKVNGEQNAVRMSEKNMMELAEFFMQESKENPRDYLAKYKECFLNAEESMTEETAEEIVKEDEKQEEPDLHEEQQDVTAEKVILCPKCGAPMVKRTATKGQNAGKEFWGCPMFPGCRGIVNISD